MRFDEIPENYTESYPCPHCNFGSVEQNIISGKWECDKCDFSAVPSFEDNED